MCCRRRSSFFSRKDKERAGGELDLRFFVLLNHACAIKSVRPQCSKRGVYELAPARLLGELDRERKGSLRCFARSRSIAGVLAWFWVEEGDAEGVSTRRRCEGKSGEGSVSIEGHFVFGIPLMTRLRAGGNG